MRLHTSIYTPMIPLSQSQLDLPYPKSSRIFTMILPRFSNASTMSRDMPINMLCLAIFGLIIGVCATPPNMSLTTSSATALATVTTTWRNGTDVYCPWCSQIKRSARMTDCQLLYQVPTTTSTTMDHFVFVFNHDASYLVHTAMVTSSRPFDLWFINPNKVDRPDDGYHMVFMPPQIANNTMTP